MGNDCSTGVAEHCTSQSTCEKAGGVWASSSSSCSQPSTCSQVTSSEACEVNTGPKTNDLSGAGPWGCVWTSDSEHSGDHCVNMQNNCSSATTEFECAQIFPFESTCVSDCNCVWQDDKCVQTGTDLTKAELDVIEIVDDFLSGYNDS